jgi:hypothetical protein
VWRVASRTAPLMWRLTPCVRVDEAVFEASSLTADLVAECRQRSVPRSRPDFNPACVCRRHDSSRQESCGGSVLALTAGDVSRWGREPGRESEAEADAEADLIGVG